MWGLCGMYGVSLYCCEEAQPANRRDLHLTQSESPGHKREYVRTQAGFSESEGTKGLMVGVACWGPPDWAFLDLY